jgi:hypothetical protein
MVRTAPLRQQIDRDVFDYQQLIACLSPFHKPRDKIGRLLATGEIIRIRKGLYTFGEPYRRAPISRELLANLIHGPSYVSLDYALSHHGLLPERVDLVTSVTVGRSRTFTTPFGPFSYRCLSRSRYAVGVGLEEHGDLSFLMASPEKALVDKVWTDKRFDGTRLGDYEPYLIDDLRLDPARLVGLDNDRLEAVARAYDARKIHRLVRYLQTLRGQSHA